MSQLKIVAIVSIIYLLTVFGTTVILSSGSTNCFYKVTQREGTEVGIIYKKSTGECEQIEFINKFRLELIEGEDVENPDYRLVKSVFNKHSYYDEFHNDDVRHMYMDDFYKAVNEVIRKLGYVKKGGD